MSPSSLAPCRVRQCPIYHCTGNQPPSLSVQPRSLSSSWVSQEHSPVSRHHVTSFLKVFPQGSQFKDWPCPFQLSCPLSTYTELAIGLPIQEGYRVNRKQDYKTETKLVHNTHMQQPRTSFIISMADSQRLPDF